ncbi:MAG: glycosyltransferase [Caldilineaceae bacterium]
MKIAHITATFPPYYSSTGMVCYHNARGLAALGHEVTVLTADYPKGAADSPPGVTVRRLPITFRFGNAPFLLDLLRIAEYDVIHLHHPFIFGAEMISAAAAGRHSLCADPSQRSDRNRAAPSAFYAVHPRQQPRHLWQRQPFVRRIAGSRRPLSACAALCPISGQSGGGAQWG